MKYMVVYTLGNDVVYSDDIPLTANDIQSLNKYLERIAVSMMAEYNENYCKIAVIDFSKNESFIAEFEREITVTVSRTDH